MLMGTMTTSMPVPRVASNFDEVSMHQSLLFSDSLKVLLFGLKIIVSWFLVLRVQ